MIKIILGIIGVVLNSMLLPLGQYFWKRSLVDGYTIGVFFSRNFIYGALCYVVGTVFWLFALSIFPLSKIYPFIAVSYIVAAIMGYYYLGEQIKFLNIIGYALLILSLVLITVD